MGGKGWVASGAGNGLTILGMQSCAAAGMQAHASRQEGQEHTLQRTFSSRISVTGCSRMRRCSLAQNCSRYGIGIGVWAGCWAKARSKGAVRRAAHAQRWRARARAEKIVRAAPPDQRLASASLAARKLTSGYAATSRWYWAKSGLSSRWRSDQTSRSSSSLVASSPVSEGGAPPSRLSLLSIFYGLVMSCSWYSYQFLGVDGAIKPSSSWAALVGQL